MGRGMLKAMMEFRGLRLRDIPLRRRIAALLYGLTYIGWYAAAARLVSWMAFGSMGQGGLGWPNTGPVRVGLIAFAMIVSAVLAFPLALRLLFSPTRATSTVALALAGIQLGFVAYMYIGFVLPWVVILAVNLSAILAVVRLRNRLASV